ncbi:MAG TPA: triose-phosphate isomerase [Candidatus Saccharimonadales bacterium]|nr:triose-phosphate isomerase [Candidatus Saccharimonadales bacterium]
MKKLLVVGNWKMNLNSSQASHLAHELQTKIKLHRDIEVVLAPSMLSLQPLSVQIDRRKFGLAAQDAYFKDEGAYTGEVSFTMLQDLVNYVIIGHSERRLYFNESLDLIRDKVAACVRNEITPLLCVGETNQERHNGEARQVLHDQIITGLSNLTDREVGDMVIAYEPVWAISTFGGELAKPDDMQKQFIFIRKQVSELYGTKASESLRLLYGGSVDDQSVTSYLNLKDCDGVLVGGASLNAHKFSGIVNKADKIIHKKSKSSDE